MNILDKCFIKEEKFKPQILGGKVEITIRQLSIEEGIANEEIRRDKTKTHKDMIFHAVSCAMVEPSFFSDEELKKLNTTGAGLINEIFSQIPKIGMTKKEKDEYDKKIIESAKKIMEQTPEEISEEEIEKK